MNDFKKNRFRYILLLLLFSFYFTSCIKMWLGTPEIGSKSFPIEFYIENTNYTKDENTIAHLQKCIEDKTGFHLKFTYVPDEKAVLAALTRGSAHYGLTSALSYVGAATKSSLKSVLLLTKKGQATNRAVIIGKTDYWKNKLQKSKQITHLSNSNYENILSLENNLTIAYSEPESIVGFLLPRMYLLQKKIFPNAAIFTGSFLAVLDALNENLATIGVISETFFDSKFPNFSPIQIGSQFNDFIILSTSPSLPSNTIIESSGITPFASQAIVNGITDCAQKNSTEFKKVFDADGVIKSNDKFFGFTKELYHFQQENIRILTQRLN